MHEDEGDEGSSNVDYEELALQKKEEGNQKYKEKNYRGAAKSYAEAIELDPSDATFRGNRAAALMMFNQFGEALQECEQAIATDPTFTKAYLRGAKCKMHNGDFDGATAMITAIKNRPEGKKDPTVHKELKLVGEVREKLAELIALGKAENWGEAFKGLEFILTHIAEWQAVQILVAEILIGVGQFARAGPICSALYRKDSSSSAVCTLRATTAYYTGQVESAVKLFKQVLQNDPDNRKCMKVYKMVKSLEANKAKGNEAFKRGRNQEAYDFYTTALGIDPLNKDYNATLLGNRAAACMKLKQWKKGLADCGQSLRLRPDHIKTLLRQAGIKLELERYQDAIKDYEKAKELEPNNREIRQQLQNAQLELKKSKRKNYYKILEVHKDADERVIKKAYRKMALKWHPDKNSDTPEEQTKAEAMFKEITEAYTVLSDDTKRRRYDQGADLDEVNGHGHGGGHGHGHGGMDVNDIFAQFFAQGGGR